MVGESVTIDGQELAFEMENLRSILGAVYAHPESVWLPGVELAGRSWPLHGDLGGDHLIVVDFARRYDLDRRIGEARARGQDDVAGHLETMRDRIGVLVADVSGHSVTDALLAAMLHQSFLVGVAYELACHGEVTVELFDILNTRFYHSSSVTKFVTMIYGEIAGDGTFRFISAGHPAPLVYSAQQQRFVDLDRSRLVSVPPIGIFPTENDIDQAREERLPLGVAPRPAVNEVRLLGSGDVLLLTTDGAADQARGDLAAALEPTMRAVASLPAASIVDCLHAELRHCGPPVDDVTLVAIKKH